MRKVVYVCRDPAGESLRSARAIGRLDAVRLLAICERAPAAGVFAGAVCVEDVHDTGQLIAAARRLGTVDRMVTAQETLLEPVAHAAEALGLEGMSVSAVRRALDKARLKAALDQAGIRTARHVTITNAGDANGVGFPIVLKPRNGSGALATWCVRNAEELDIALALLRPSPESPILAEEYLRGQEMSIDTIAIADEPRFHSICVYRPSIMQALEDPRIQWTCVLPRDMTGDGHRELIEQGRRAVRALSVGNAMTHMEGFLLDEGGVRFTDATLRPAGARIAPMLAFAYDIDPYLAWARVAVDGCFDGPWERRYAVGTVFLRGTGRGTVRRSNGLQAVRRHAGELIVEARLPRAGATKSATYTGDGYITVRHPETSVVEEALAFISETVRIEYSHAEPPVRHTGERWRQRLHDARNQLYKPAWDNEGGPVRDINAI